MNLKLSFLLFLLLLNLGCSDKTQKSQESSGSNIDVTHPTEENTYPDIDKVSITREVSIDSSVFNIELIETLGDTDSNDDIFGEIVGVALSENGSIIVLDAGIKEIRIYNKSLELISRNLQEGKGPGEFQHPESIAYNNKNVFVIDRFLKLNKYRLENGVLDFTKFEILKYTPESICLNSDGVFLRGIRYDAGSEAGTKIIHKYSQKNLEYSSSYGDHYKSDLPLTVNQLSDGPIGCSDESVFYAHEYFPYVVSQSLATNEIEWVAELSSFEGLEITTEYEGGRPAVVQSIKGNVTEFISRILDVGPNHILVQSEYRNRKTRVLEAKKYVLEKATGEAVYLDVLPGEMIQYIDAEKIITSTLNGEPHLKIYHHNFQF